MPAFVLGLARRPRCALLLGTALQACAVLVVGFPAAAQPAANAQPQGGHVVAGSASISQTATQTTITQGSQRAAVDWTSFDVGRQQTVKFQQPSSSSVTLNRVTGPDPSQIAGKIQANGQIVLTNQSGVMFTQGAQVDTAGLIVSAAGISNRNFMAGRMVFDQPAKADAKIVNEGTITVRQAGLAALVAPQVANSGTINARLGHVVLAGARAATLDLYGDGLVSIDVTRQVTQSRVGPDGKPVTALVTNTGVIQANGGTVQLSASAVEGVVTNLVTAGGQITARSRGSRTGTIVVDATGGGATVTGTLAAEGRRAGTVGGRVQVNATGPVTIASGARISASGKAGGGTVALGTTVARAKGGSSVSAPAASALTIQQGATVAANATGAGNGGNVTLLSAGSTRVDGALSARGGPAGGDGGFIEISGKTLGMSGQADVYAPAGLAGSILLDPDYLTIVEGASGSGSQDPAFATGGTITVSDPSVGADTISNAVINALTGNVLLQANKTLTVGASIALTNTPHQSLTLEAGGTITINSGVAVLASGDVILATGGAGPGLPPAAQSSPLISIQGSVASTAGSISLLSGAEGTIAVGASGGLSAGTGQRLTLQSDVLTVASGSGSLSAPNGTVEVAPASALDMALQGTGGMAVSDAALQAVSASTLRLGAATIDGTQVTTAGAISIYGTFGFPGTVDFHASGAVAEVGPYGALNVGTVTGASASFSADAPSTIETVGSYTATGAFSLSGVPGLTLAGPIAAQTVSIATTGTIPLIVTGTVVATGPLSLTASHIDMRAGALVQGSTATLLADLISLADGATLGGSDSVLDLNTPSGSGVTITEADNASITGSTLQATLGGIAGDVSLLGNNTLAALGVLPVGGQLVLADTVPLLVTGTVSAAGIYLQAPTLSIQTGGRLLAPDNSVSLETDRLSIVPGAAVAAGTFELAPASAGSEAVLGTAGGLLASLDGITASNVRIGAVTQPGGTLETTAGTVTLAGDFGRSGISLALHSMGGISQTAGVLTAGTLAIAAAGAVTLPDANAIPALGSVTARSFTLNDAGQGGTLVIAGPVAATDVAIDGPGAIAVTGSIFAAGTLALSAQTSGIAVAAGATINAGTLDLSGNGVVEDPAAIIRTDYLSSGQGLTGDVVLVGTMNAIAALGSITVSGGTLRLVDTGTVAGLAIEGPVQATSIDILTGSEVLSVLGAVAATTAIDLAGSGIAIGAGGTVSAPTITIQAGQDGITLGNGSTLGTSGTRLDLSALGGMTEDAGAIILADTLTSSAGFGGTVSLAGTANAIATIENVSGPRLWVTDAQDLTVAGTMTTEVLRIVDAGTVTVSGTVLPFAASGSMSATITGMALDLPGTVSVGAHGALTLRATGGDITETGRVVAGELRGSATGDVSLAGSDNEIARIGDFGAGSFSLSSAIGLDVRGSLRSRGAVSIETAGTLAVTGTIVPLGSTSITINLAAASLSLPGLLSDGGAGTVRLASSGDIAQSGTLIAGTLAGTAAGSAVFSGASNQIRTLGDFAAESLNLNDGHALDVAGLVQAGSSIALVSMGSLTVSGTIAPLGARPIAVELSGASMALPGYVDDGGTGTTSLRSAAGDIRQTGTLIAGSLSGSASGDFLLTGAVQVSELGDISASRFTLNDSRGLTVAGTLSAGQSVTIVDADTLSVPGAIVASNGSAISVGLTASGIGIDGLISAGSGGSMTLLAGGGGVVESGTLVAGRLNASSPGDVLLGGAGPSANAIATIGSVSADHFALTDGIGLDVAGTVQASSAVTIAGQGVLRVDGAITPAGATAIAVDLTGASVLIGGLVSDDGSGATRLVASTGSIEATGTLIAGTLSGSSATSTELFGNGSNQVARLGDWTAGSFTLYDGRDLLVSGTVSAQQSASLQVAGTLAVAGTIAAPTIDLSASAVGIGSGALVSDGGTGTVSLTASRGDITEAGILMAGGLSAIAAGSITLAGSTPTSNSIVSTGTIAAGTDLLLNTAGSLDVRGPMSAGPGHVLAIRTDGLAIEGSLSAPRGRVFIAPATDGGTISLDDVRRTGTLSLIQSDFDAIHTGTLTLGAVPGGAVPAGAIAVTGTVIVSSASAPLLALYAMGDIGGAGVLGATTLTGAAATVSLTGPNEIGQLGAFDASGSLSLVNATPLTVSGLVQSPTVTIQDMQGLTLSGTIQSTTASLTASSIALSGTLVADAQASLNATGGAIGGSGLIVTGVLSGAAATSVFLSGPNQAATLGTFSAPGGFTYNSAIPLSVAGTVSGGPAIDMTINGTLAEQGELVANQVSVWAGGIMLTGEIIASDRVMLDAGTGAITGAGSIRTSLLTGRAGSLDLSGEGNAIAALGDFTTSTGFTLANASDLVVRGTVSDGSAVAISQQYDLSVAGVVRAPNVNLTANAIGIGGEVNAPGSLGLIALSGGIVESGTIATGVLRGSAAASANLTGTNTMSQIGDFSAAGGLSLSDNVDLVIAGLVNGGAYVTLSGQGSISVTGTLAGNTGTLNAAALSISGAMTAPDGLVLAATAGSITGGGTVSTARLTGSARDDLDLSGPNRILQLDGFSADRIVLANRSDLLLTGSIGKGRSVDIANTGTITGSATITASESVTFDSRAAISLAGAIIQAGGPDAGSLGLTAAGSIDLRNTRLGGHTITVDAGDAITIQGGTVSAGNSGSVTLGPTARQIDLQDAEIDGRAITIRARDLISIADGSIRTGGTIVAGRVYPTDTTVLPGDGRAGLLFSAPRLVQTGTLTIDGSATPVAEFSATASVELATLSASSAWLVLDLAQGRATATEFSVRRLDLFYTGTTGSAVLAGTVGGVTGSEAAASTLIWPYPSTDYTLNGCPIGSPNCILLVRDPIPAQKAPQTLEFAVPRTPADDPELLGVLPNVARQDY